MSTRNDAMRPPLCPSCNHVAWIRDKGNGNAKCKKCGHVDRAVKFYMHERTYQVLGLSGTAQLPGEIQ